MKRCIYVVKKSTNTKCKKYITSERCNYVVKKSRRIGKGNLLKIIPQSLQYIDSLQQHDKMMKLGARVWLIQTRRPQSLGKIQSAKQKGKCRFIILHSCKCSAQINKTGTQGEQQDKLT